MFICAWVYLQSIRYQLWLVLKGKSAISIAKNFKGRQRNFTGEAFLGKGYYISTAVLDAYMVKEYIRNQDKNDVDRDQLNIGI